MVYGPGGYRFGDYMRLGTPLRCGARGAAVGDGVCVRGPAGAHGVIVTRVATTTTGVTTDRDLDHGHSDIRIPTGLRRLPGIGTGGAFGGAWAFPGGTRASLRAVSKADQRSHRRKGSHRTENCPALGEGARCRSPRLARHGVRLPPPSGPPWGHRSSEASSSRSASATMTSCLATTRRHSLRMHSTP